MQGWRLTVWSRFVAPEDQVWAHKTDPLTLQHEFPPWLRIHVSNIEGLRRAIRETGTGTFPGRITGPLGIIGMKWPFEIQATRPPRYYRDGSVNAVYGKWVHEHRLEPTPIGMVRYVDDVRFEVKFGRLGAELTRQLFIERHRRAARFLAADSRAVGRSWLRRLDERVPVDVAAQVAH